jgi:hypothetical protein
MTTFTVSFDPKLPSGGEASPPKEPNWSRIYAITEGLEYDMTYHVGGQAFGYYPTDVVGLLSDLVGAREELDRNQNWVDQHERLYHPIGGDQRNQPRLF